MDEIQNEIKKIKKSNYLRFLDLQSFESKTRIMQGNTLLFWQEKKIKESIAPIKEINQLLAIIEKQNTLIFEKPTISQELKKLLDKTKIDIDDWEQETTLLKKQYIHNHFEAFRKKNDVVEIMTSKKDFRNKILDNLEKGIEEFIFIYESKPINSFEYIQGLKNFFAKMTSCINLYRKLKYENK